MELGFEGLNFGVVSVPSNSIVHSGVPFIMAQIAFTAYYGEEGTSCDYIGVGDGNSVLLAMEWYYWRFS